MTSQVQGIQKPFREVGGKRSIITGVLLGIAFQLLGLYTRLDGLSAIAGFILLIIGIFLRWASLRPASSPPPIFDKEALAKYRRLVRNWNDINKLDFAVWGGTMLLVEAIAVSLYFMFGFHLPVAPGTG